MCLEAVVWPQRSCHGEVQVTTSLLSLLDEALPPGARTRTRKAKVRQRRGFRCAARGARGAAGRALSESSSKIVTKAVFFLFFLHSFPGFSDGNQPWQPVTVWLSECKKPRRGGLSSRLLVVSAALTSWPPGTLHVAEDLQRGRRQKWGDGPWWAMMAHDGHGRSLLTGLLFGGPKVQVWYVTKGTGQLCRFSGSGLWQQYLEEAGGTAGRSGEKKMAASWVPYGTITVIISNSHE